MKVGLFRFVHMGEKSGLSILILSPYLIKTIIRLLVNLMKDVL